MPDYIPEAQISTLIDKPRTLLHRYHHMHLSSEHNVPVMVVFDLPKTWPQGLVNSIPAQRILVQKLLAEGVIQSYSVAADRTKVWMVLVVEDDQFAVDQIISTFPILDYVNYSWEPLLFTNDTSSVMHYSLN